MTKRRRLPAPPLVLTHYLGRFHEGDPRASVVLSLARFLDDRGLLTKGGIKSLAEGLSGRNSMVSLTLQDVRSFAHGLAVELLDTHESAWPSRTELYFQTYDKGKPRRPTHLQRLYLEWSRDLAWPGLVSALFDHPHLWPEVECALERSRDPAEAEQMIALAWECRERIEPWCEVIEGGGNKACLLTLLPLLPSAPPPWRLPYLAGLAEREQVTMETDWVGALLRACCVDLKSARSLQEIEFPRERLEQLVLEFRQRQFLEPWLLFSLAAVITKPESLETLLNGLAPGDPIRSVSYGPRPGLSWLGWVESELLELTSIRS